MKKYEMGGAIDAGLEKAKRKPLPSETIREDIEAKKRNELAKDALLGGPQGVIGALAKRLKDNVMGTEEQNRDAEMREKARAKANPEGYEAKYRDFMGKEYKKGGKVSSASKRADGCATKGKTKGRFV